MHDRHVRYPNDPGPLVPGKGMPPTCKDPGTDVWIKRPGRLRYTLLPASDPDVVRIRERIPEEGRGLFVARYGDTAIKALIEAYYPEDIRDRYYVEGLDLHRKHEVNLGRLVVVNEMFKWVGELHPLRINEIRRNARNARADLKRNIDEQSLILAMEHEENTRVQAAETRWGDFYVDAWKETRDFAMGKPRKSAYTPRGSR